MSITTPITKLLGIKHPVILAGMNVAAGPDLAAAVTNAGGLGVIGGVGYTPEFLQKQIDELKAELNDKNAPFGVDLLLPQVGGSARKTNYDYTKGKLSELIDVIIKNKTALFVSAVGLPPKEVVDKLHAAKIPIMNMCGHPKHVVGAIKAGCDIVCCQGGEGGGHTGDIPTSLLIPAAVEIASKHKSEFTGLPVQVVAAGGIYNGQGLAGMLAMGANAVWVGTRFVCAEEAGAPKTHQDTIINAKYEDTVRTLIFTGRPLRVVRNRLVNEWENNRQAEIKEKTSKGILPVGMEVEDFNDRPYLSGITAGAIKDVQPAKKIIDDMVSQAVALLKQSSGYVQAKL